MLGGALLIFFGLVFLAANLGWIHPGYFYRLGQLWPMWLVVAGLLLMSRSFPRLRYWAGAVVVLMLLAAVAQPQFLDSFHGRSYFRHGWGAHSFWGLLFLAGAVWVLYNLFGRSADRATQ
jgi:drug/metabolite transporter (DMT)-like permease